jgi:hypothetical protein
LRGPQKIVLLFVPKRVPLDGRERRLGLRILNGLLGFIVLKRAAYIVEDSDLSPLSEQEPPYLSSCWHGSGAVPHCLVQVTPLT